MALNCWEAMKCGREPGGSRERAMGACPAATLTRANGIHHGKNAGRACWAVAGTLCGGKVQGTFASKMVNCLSCDFYLSVRDEEAGGFRTSGEILKAIA